MIVEFVGPSCAGKSTLVLSAWQQLLLLGVTAHRHKADRDGAEYDPSQTPAPEADWLAANPGILDDHRMWPLLRSVAFMRSLSGQAAVHLVDGGPIKRCTYGLWQVIDRCGGREALANWLPRPDLAVLVDCDPQVRIARVRTTNRSHARGQIDEELHARHEFALAQARWIRDELGVPMLHVDTTDCHDHGPSVAEQVVARRIQRGDDLV